MLPFINVFGRELPMYGVCMITGAFLAILFACITAKRKQLVRLDILLASCFCFIFGLIGAKLLYNITDIPNIVKHFETNEFDFRWLFERLVNGGIVFYGGLLGGVFGGWLYIRMFRLDFWKHADAMIPFMPLAHGFGRIGCFCAGCCYGRQVDPPFGWYFPNAIGAPHDVPLFPVQLFEASFLLLLLFPIMQIYASKKRQPGQVVGMYLACYGIFRFFNEFLRDDSIRGIFGGVSTSQWISLVLVPIGLLLLSGKISGRLVPARSRYVYEDGEGGEYESYIENTEDADFMPCAVCTGCGKCDRMYAERARQSETADNGSGQAGSSPEETRQPEPQGAEGNGGETEEPYVETLQEKPDGDEVLFIDLDDSGASGSSQESDRTGGE